MMTPRKTKYLFFLLLLTAGFRVSAQNVDSLLFVGDSLRNLYRFEESLLLYEDALDLAQDKVESALFQSSRQSVISVKG